MMVTECSSHTQLELKLKLQASWAKVKNLDPTLNDAGASILLLFLELIYTFKSELELVVIELEHSSSSCLGSNLKINLKIAGDNLETTSSTILGTCKSSDSFPLVHQPCNPELQLKLCVATP